MKFLQTTILVITLMAAPVWANPAPVANAPAEPQEEIQLPEGEKRLRQGIMLLGMLYQSMAEINNKSAAEAAVPKIMQISEELQQWTRAFNNLPPLSEPEVLVYEERYLPIIRKVNKLIQTQADRLGSAEYYGSRTLPAVLVRLAQVGH